MSSRSETTTVAAPVKVFLASPAVTSPGPQWRKTSTPAPCIDSSDDEKSTAYGDAADGGKAAGGDNRKTVRRDRPKVGRNDPCPCGSGKKYKKCHGREDEGEAEADGPG